MKTQIERAEPSRGAPDAAHTPGAQRAAWSCHAQCELWARSQHNLSGQEQVNELATIIEREAGHVVLLEALQTIADFAVGNGDVCEIIAKRARAAIQQAERT